MIAGALDFSPFIYPGNWLPSGDAAGLNHKLKLIRKNNPVNKLLL